MKIIMRLSDMIDEEIDDALKYAKCAMEHDDDPELARTFTLLANEELNHMNLLHNQVARIIKLKRERDGEPPAPMMAVYEYVHQKQIDKVADVRSLLV